MRLAVVLQVPVIPLILFSVSLVAAITFYLAYRSLAKNLFNKVLLWTIFYVFVNSFYAFSVEVFYPAEPWKNKIAPFILMYGPILYFGIVALRDRVLPPWKVFLHAIPFIAFSVLFLALMFGAIKNSEEVHDTVYKQLYRIGPLSFLGYTLYSVFSSRKIFGRFRDKLLMFVFGRVFLLFLATIIMILSFSGQVAHNPNAVYLLRIIVYACMLIFILMIFNYTFNRLLKRSAMTTPYDDNRQEERENVKYERSPLTHVQLLAYQKRLVAIVEDEKLFLDTSLSLSSLANQLKIPNHHLTQVFNMQLKQTFYQFINGCRVNYACQLLEDQKLDMNLEELAEKSGFNAKVSFNRQFKQIKGCTPSEYRDRIRA
ncbi:helix-turn-helix domain-containing protein [Pedobacter sp. KR3-3]|uniref:Helix-turn-helix domain-containing protein n=1 Tax=Pedobacter albus TaxID=3113905 RepID=A0ABU7I6J1_9SPHI|nr:helix-turn-helix domain-containing protein [Pedobacter sp. KR3-3]MEE1944859.1 helix-turn-helix domain-containing protein [Pedobacter sp. KR3-3]